MRQQLVQLFVDPAPTVGLERFGKDAVELLDLSVRRLELVELEDLGKELIVGLAVGHVVCSAERIRQGVHGANSGVAERDTGVVARRQHVS